MTSKFISICGGLLLVSWPSFGAPAQSFVDEFTGPALNPGWQVLAGAGNYSLTGSALRYYNEGPFSSPTGWGATSLSIAHAFDGDNWTADIKATYHLLWLASGSYTGPAGANFANSSGAQEPKVDVVFEPVSNANRSALSTNQYLQYSRSIDAWYGVDDFAAVFGGTSVSALNPADPGIVDNVADGTYWMRVIRNGGKLTAQYSYDGVNYTTAFKTSLANPGSSYNQLVLTGTTYSTVGSYTDYDYVRINVAPEPGTMAMIAFPLVLFGWRRARKSSLPDTSVQHSMN